MVSPFIQDLNKERGMFCSERMHFFRTETGPRGHIRMKLRLIVERISLRNSRALTGLAT